MKRVLLLAPVLALALTGCSDGTNDNNSLDSGNQSQPSATAQPTAEPTASETQGPAATGPCKPSGTGTTDVKKKPEYTVPKEKAPEKTTNTDIVCGTGKEATAGSTVTVDYVGVNYETGEEFDTSWGKAPFDFTIGEGVIPGFSIGVTGMKEGGRRLVVIPPAEGYGDQGPAPGKALAFLIDLKKVA